MQKHLFSIVICLLSATAAIAQAPDYKVVFDMTSRDTVNQQALVRELGLISQANPDARMEVVVYGQGLPLVLNEGTAQQKTLQQILSGGRVTVKVCAMTMKRNNVSKDRLLPGVEVVPDGIYEIISKQREGWGYIKVAH